MLYVIRSTTFILEGEGEGGRGSRNTSTQEKIKKHYTEKAKNMYNDFIKKNKINTEEKVNAWLAKLEKFKDPLYPYLLKNINNEK